MKTIKIAMLAAAMLGLGGCAAFRAPEKPTIAIRYEANPPNQLGLLRIFDFNGNTVLQFVDMTKSVPTIYLNSSGTPADFQIVGQQLAVLTGAPRVIRIDSDSESAFFVKDSSASTQGQYSYLPEAQALQQSGTTIDNDTRPMRRINR